MLILALAAALRFYQLDGQSFWADEGNSVVLAARTPAQIIRAAAADIHPPAYYLLLAGWGKLAGLGEAGARSLSALLGVMLVAALYGVGRQLRGTSLGLVAAALAAVNPFLIYYSQEARMYELLALCATLASLALLLFLVPARRRSAEPSSRAFVPSSGRGASRLSDSTELVEVSTKSQAEGRSRRSRSAERSRRSRSAEPSSRAQAEGRSRRSLLASSLYLLAVTLGLYTHYAFPVHLLALNLVFLIWWGKSRRLGKTGATHLVTWGILQAIPALLYAPWLPTAFRQLGAWPSPPLSLGPDQALIETFRLFLCGPISCPPHPALLALAVGLSLALLLFALSPLGFVVSAPRPELGTKAQPNGRRPQGWLGMTLPLLWLLTPLATMLLLRIFSPVFFKFLLIAAPAYLLLLALGIDKIGVFVSANISRPRAPLLAALLRLFLLAPLLLPTLLVLDRYYHDTAVARDDYRSIAAYLRAIAGPNDAIILDAPGQSDVFDQYDHGPAPLHPLPAARPLDPAATRAQLDRILAASQRVYAIFWATEQADPDGLIENYLATHAFEAWDAWVGNLRFVAYSAGSPPTATPFVSPPRFGDAIRLDAAGLSPTILQPGDIARVLLRWQIDAPLPTAYKTTLQLLDSTNQILAQVDSEPAGGARPTTSWQPGETMSDPYGLPIPLASPPGDYRLILALYDPATGVRLPVTTNEGVSDHLLLGAATIAPPTPRAEPRDEASPPPLAILSIRHRASETRGPFTFLGHDRYKQGFGHAPDAPLASGDLLHLTTWWQAKATPDGDYTFALLLDGRELGRFPLAGPGYPTSQWLPGPPWRGEHTMQLPSEAATGGKHDLALQLIAPDGQPLGAPIRLQPKLSY